jgi:hypothetical protein
MFSGGLDYNPISYDLLSLFFIANFYNAPYDSPTFYNDLMKLFGCDYPHFFTGD